MNSGKDTIEGFLTTPKKKERLRAGEARIDNGAGKERSEDREIAVSNTSNRGTA
jgi:hypothetical protein